MSSFYDSHGVAKLDLSNPEAQVLFPRGHYTYAFGNTPGIGLTEHFGTSKSDNSLNFLLLGSGDIRNLLFTVSELSQRSPEAIPGHLSFHLNDSDATVLARDVIILETAQTMDPDCDRDVDFLWNLWYNLTLSSDDYKRLQTILKSLVSQEYEKSDLQFGSKDVFTEFLKIVRDWILMEMNVDDVVLQRKRLMMFGLNMGEPENLDKEQDYTGFIAAITALTDGAIQQLLTPIDEQKLGSKCLQKSGLLYKEIYSYFQSGSTSQVCTDSKVNPTLIRPSELKWKVHYGSCPFSGYIPIDRNRLENNKSITKACKEELRTLVKRFQSFGRFQSGKPRIKVTFWSGDALELCRGGLPKDLLFDVIDTSNLSDHIGLLNILVCCASKLKEPGQSQLMTSTMLWRASGVSSLAEYLECSLGMRQTLYPTVLGLKLAEDLDLGKSDIMNLKESRRLEDRLVWVKTEPERSPITFARSPDVLDALKSMASRCCRLPSPKERCLQLSGVTLSSPVTFFLAFLQMAETFKESAEHVLSYVEESLLTVRLFKKRACTKLCGLSWSVLKCLAGISVGVVVKVEVQVTFPTSSLSRNTPEMQAVLFEDPNDARFLTVWPVSQLEQRTFHRPVHLFYNNVRYDYDKETVTFLMLEKDWEAVHPETVLILISSSVSCTSNAVKLKYNTKAAKNNVCCLVNEENDMKDKSPRAKENMLRSKKRKSRLARNLSCVRVSVSCMSDASGRGLQKYDSSYRLDVLSSQDLVIHNSGHVHGSKDCLVSLEMKPMRLFQSGIDSPSFHLNDDVKLKRKIVNDVIIHNGGHAIEDEERSVTAATTERMDGTVKSFGLLDVTLVTPQTTRSDHLELLALEEHFMCYNADIQILTSGNTACLTGSPTVQYHPKEMPTAVEISLDSERKPLMLYFSAPVNEKSSKVQVLTNKNRLRCHFPKSELGVYGQACINRPPILDFASLPTWTGMEDLNLLMFFAQKNEKEAAQEDRKDFVELQNALQCIIASFVECPQKNTCFTIHEPCDTDTTTPNFTLVVHEVYSHKQVPLAKVLFCDHTDTAYPSEDARNSMSAAKYKEVLLEVMGNKEESPMISVTREGQVHLKRLLYSNAKRVEQSERLKPVWIASVLQLRF